MIIFWQTGGTSGGASTDPGESHVEDGITYTINGVPKTGSLALSGPTANQIAAAVWGSNPADYTSSGTFGLLMQKLLTVGKFLGLK